MIRAPDAFLVEFLVSVLPLISSGEKKVLGLLAVCHIAQNKVENFSSPIAEQNY